MCTQLLSAVCECAGMTQPDSCLWIDGRHVKGSEIARAEILSLLWEAWEPNWEGVRNELLTIHVDVSVGS